MDETPSETGTVAPATHAAKHRNKGILRSVLLLLLAAWVLRSLIVAPFSIPSGSMLPTMAIGDYLFVQKWPYGYSRFSFPFQFPSFEGRLFAHYPKRGDIIVFRPPGQEGVDFIKRAIGLPGDTIEVRGGRLIINGKPVKSVSRPPAMIPVDANVPCGIQFSGFEVAGPGGKAYCRLPIVRETLPNGVTYDTIDLGESPGDDFGPVKVTPDHLFLMGDNRDRSADSRFSLGPPENGLGGPVPWENIGGRAEFITFSLDGTAQTLNPLSWIQSLRSGRAGDSLRAHKE